VALEGDRHASKRSSKRALHFVLVAFKELPPVDAAQVRKFEENLARLEREQIAKTELAKKEGYPCGRCGSQMCEYCVLPENDPNWLIRSPA
jgi:hypothetical protein